MPKAGAAAPSTETPGEAKENASATPPPRGDAPVVVVVRAEGGTLDAANVRNEVARELGVPAAAPESAPKVTRGTLTVTWKATTRELVVGFRHPERGNLTRVVDAPDKPDEVAHAAALLAGNLARDQEGNVAGPTGGGATPTGVVSATETGGIHPDDMADRDAVASADHEALEGAAGAAETLVEPAPVATTAAPRTPLTPKRSNSPAIAPKREPAPPPPAPASPATKPESNAAPAAPPAPPSATAAPASADELYEQAHRAHFSGRDPSAALAAWGRYLAAAPRGRFALEARYNRALALSRLGRRSEAARALEPFAAGDFGGYRQAEAQRLLQSLRGAP